MCGGHLGNIWIKQQPQWVESTALTSLDLDLDPLLVLSEERALDIRKSAGWSSCATKDTGVLVSMMAPFL